MVRYNQSDLENHLFNAVLHFIVRHVLTSLSTTTGYNAYVIQPEDHI